MGYEAFFKISYGLYVVSSGDGDKINGYVANTAFQVTAEPQQMAISCNRENYTAQLIEKSGLFSVSVLRRETSNEIIGLFGYKSGRDTDKFAKAGYIRGETGVPILTDDTIAWFECKVVEKFDVGTHIIFIGKIENYELLLPDEEPLTYDYYRNVKKMKAPKNAPTFIDSSLAEKNTEEEKSGPKKYRCTVCGHVYDPAEGDPDSGIPSGTAFEDLPDDWHCPVCGVGKGDFEPI